MICIIGEASKEIGGVDHLGVGTERREKIQDLLVKAVGEVALHKILRFCEKDFFIS